MSSTTVLGLTVATLLLFTGLGVWFSRGSVDSVEDFITARDSAGEETTTATLVASVMGVWILLSAPEAGALYGIAAVIGYGIGGAVPILAYATVGPRVRELIPEGHSLTEYAYARYGDAMYAFVISVSVLYMFVFLAAELTGISLALHFVAGVPQEQTAVLVGGFVLLYTGYGGLRASIVTDTIQTLVILPLLVLTVGAVLLTLGDTSAVYDGITTANPTLLDAGSEPPRSRTGSCSCSRRCWVLLLSVTPRFRLRSALRATTPESPSSFCSKGRSRSGSAWAFCCSRSCS